MPYSDEELLADIRAVADVVERSPSLQDYRDHGEYSVTTIYRRFDSWQGAVARAGFEPRDPNTRTSMRTSSTRFRSWPTSSASRQRHAR